MPRRAVTGLALVAVVGLAVLAGLFLRHGEASFVPAPLELSFPEDAPAAMVEGFEGENGLDVVAYRDGEEMTVTVGVTNNGRGVTEVIDVSLAAEEKPLLVQVGEVEPFEIAAGETVEVPLRLRSENCRYYHERQLTITEEALVTFVQDGEETVETVPLARPLVARSPMLWQCPDRTIDREDDRISD